MGLSAKVKRQKARLTADDRDRLVRLLVETYQADSQGLQRAFPELAQQLKVLIQSQNRGDTQVKSRLTERERSRRLEALAAMKSRKRVSGEEAVVALEHGAALLEDAFAPGLADRTWLLKLAKQVTGLSVDLKGTPRDYPVQPGESSRSVLLIRGIVLNLTWDGKLLSVSVQPRELLKRRNALAFVGSGVDPREDVAETHDDYLAEALSTSG